MEERETKQTKLQLELDVFEGPLDLLLHLINKLEIDIYDIPIAKITSQYLQYIDQMKTDQLDIASEYFVMAASLMRIKSEMLVPRNENEATLDEDFYDEDDPRKALIDLLLEYKKIKEVVPKFEARHSGRADFFGKDPTDISDYHEQIELKDQGLDISDLAKIFHEVLARQRLETPQPTTIDSEEITVTAKMDDIFTRLSNAKEHYLPFSDLLNQLTRKEMVVTFLALLELMKDNRIIAQQETIASEILIKKKYEES